MNASPGKMGKYVGSGGVKREPERTISDRDGWALRMDGV
jgi:hypothetical protein